jgi:hypothetical protein
MVLQFFYYRHLENLKDIQLCIFTQCLAEIIRVPQVDLGTTAVVVYIRKFGSL